MEASRKHGSFDTRWPCVRKESAPSLPFDRESPTTPPRLSVVPTEPGPSPAEQEREDAGTQRLLAAMAARREEGT